MTIVLTKARCGKKLFIRQAFVDNKTRLVKKIIYQRVNKKAFNKLGGRVSKVPKCKKRK